MKALEQKILKEAKIFPGQVLKAGSFLNHQIDIDFLESMGDEIARLFKDDNVTKILTIEASGIAIAVAAAMKMHVPVVFAKKGKSSNVSNDLYKSRVHSYTHNVDFDAIVSKEYLNEGDRILIIDDFLATGEAINGLVDIVNQSKATVAGIAAAIEKHFQGGGDELRGKGYHVESLAKIEAMTDDGLTFSEN